jgi:alkanesulfonate monooxygenase SsuD/methylene tetrahydromethanopterin reductase-like flavin-dependent oxidoreductase (luciferase family)
VALKPGIQGSGQWVDGLAGAVVLPAFVDEDGDLARARVATHLAQRYAMDVAPELVERYCCAGTPAECAARVAAYAEAGAEHVIFNPGCETTEYLSQVERLAEVAP